MTWNFGRSNNAYFYPRPPRGGRHSKYNDSLVGWMISIHALREEGDQMIRRVRGESSKISIHALREEGDICSLFSP